MSAGQVSTERETDTELTRFEWPLSKPGGFLLGRCPARSLTMRSPRRALRAIERLDVQRCLAERYGGRFAPLLPLCCHAGRVLFLSPRKLAVSLHFIVFGQLLPPTAGRAWRPNAVDACVGSHDRHTAQ
jgi:hypothetical protein